jgi:predicted neutral ceramidase superfamily lipid hydrolase
VKVLSEAISLTRGISSQYLWSMHRRCTFIARDTVHNQTIAFLFFLLGIVRNFVRHGDLLNNSQKSTALRNKLYSWQLCAWMILSLLCYCALDRMLLLLIALDRMLLLLIVCLIVLDAFLVGGVWAEEKNATLSRVSRPFC